MTDAVIINGGTATAVFVGTPDAANAAASAASASASAASASASAASVGIVKELGDAGAVPALLAALTTGRAVAPVSGSVLGSATLVMADPVARTGTITAIRAFGMNGGGTLAVKRFTKSGNAVTQVGTDYNITIAAGLNTLSSANGDFAAIPVNANEFIGYYAFATTGKTAFTSATTADGSGWWQVGASGNLSTGTLGSLTTTTRLEIGFDISSPAFQPDYPKLIESVAHDQVVRADMPAGANSAAASFAPYWVRNPANYEFDFSRGLGWNPATQRVVQFADWFSLTAAAGYAETAAGNLVYFLANRPKMTDRGLRLGSDVANLLANPFAPATQVVAVTGGTTYALSVWGPGSAAVSGAAVAGQARQRQPVYFTPASSGNITITVAGALVAFQLEATAGTLNYYNMPVSGSASRDAIAPLGDIYAIMNGTAATIELETEDLYPNTGVILGSLSNANEQLFRHTVASRAASFNASPSATLQANSNPGSFEQIMYMALANDGSGRALAANNSTVSSDANPRGIINTIGRAQTIGSAAPPACGYLRWMSVKPSRDSNAALPATSNRAKHYQIEDINYSSSIDRASFPFLKGRIAFNPRLANAPIIVLMHGWDQSYSAFDPEVANRFAEKGFFAIMPGMRGDGGVAASRDASARELYDILDAVAFARTNFPAYCHPQRCYLSGYSGGGGNALGIAMKAPDFFNAIAAHFPIADYGYDHTNGWYYTGPAPYPAEIAASIGDPALYPSRYRSRYAIEGVPSNLIGGHLYMFQDDGDTLVSVVNSQLLASAMASAGNANLDYYESATTDVYRWVHDLPNLSTTTGAQTTRSEDIFLRKFLDPRAHLAWRYPLSGSCRIHGWLKTKRFEIWLGDGRRDTATLTWDVTTGSYTITPVQMEAANVAVTVAQGPLTASGTIAAATTFTVA